MQVHRSNTQAILRSKEDQTWSGSGLSIGSIFQFLLQIGWIVTSKVTGSRMKSKRESPTRKPLSSLMVALSIFSSATEALSRRFYSDIIINYKV